MCKLPCAGCMCSKLVYLFSFSGFAVVLNGGKKWMCVLKLKPVLFKKK